MSWFNTSVMQRWTVKKIFGLAVVTSLILGAPAANAQDACASIVGNLLASLNCGFDIDPLGVGVTTGWTGLAGSSANQGSARNVPATIVSPNLSLNAGDYLVSFKVRLRFSGADFTIPAISLISGPNTVPLVTNLTVSFGSAFTDVSYVGSIVNPGTYQIQFTGLSTSSSRAILVDSFSIVAVPVPEPATMVLLGSLCSAVAGYKYKRKQSV